ncbi:hypothetical protein D3C76_1415960 [compost metagenome]
MAITSLCWRNWRSNGRVSGPMPAKSLMMQIRWSWPAEATQLRSTLSSCASFSLSTAKADKRWLALTTALHNASTRARLRNGRT